MLVSTCHILVRFEAIHRDCWLLDAFGCFLMASGRLLLFPDGFWMLSVIS